MARQNGSRSSSNRQWNAYSPPEPDDAGSGSRGQPSFFYYNPEGSSQSQWWYNTFAEGQEQPPSFDYNNPYVYAAPGYYPTYNYTPESTTFNQKYKEYRPQRSPSPHPSKPVSRSPTPPLSQTPSPEYLAVADEPSHQLSEPSTSRKLLVLDLNGTLLLRSPRSPRPKGRSRKNANDEQSAGSSQPRPRTVHQRPYMSSFRSYVLHSQTKAWLDVMIWSSAQPHNVADMVEKCFGDQKDQLVAVWARDMLGLPETHYYRKVQTTKDLNTPWTKLFSLPLEEKQNGETSTAQEAGAGQGQTLHSAMTTILMDDSPRKAGLQPYNHLCIKEYTADIRAKDVSMLQMEKQKAAAELAKEESVPVLPISLPTQPPPVVDQMIHFQHDGSMGIQPDATLLRWTSPSTSLLLPQDEIPGLIFSDPSKEEEQRLVLLQEEEQASAPKKRKRKAKKKAQVEPCMDFGEIEFDETLLAIVGLLDEMKSQSNISNWMKSGGLWGPFPPSALPAQTATSVTISKLEVEADTNGKDLSAEYDQGTGKRQRREDVGVIEDLSELIGPFGNDAAVASVGGSALFQEQAKTGSALMWFDDPSTVSHWAGKGKLALGSLGIPIVHGIDR